MDAHFTSEPHLHDEVQRGLEGYKEVSLFPAMRTSRKRRQDTARALLITQPRDLLIEMYTEHLEKRLRNKKKIRP